MSTAVSFGRVDAEHWAWAWACTSIVEDGDTLVVVQVGVQVVNTDHIGTEPLNDGGVPLADVRPREGVVLVAAAADEGLLATGLVSQATNLELATVGGEIVLVALNFDLRQGRGQSRTEGDQRGRQLWRGCRISIRRVREADRARWGCGHEARRRLTCMAKRWGRSRRSIERAGRAKRRCERKRERRRPTSDAAGVQGRAGSGQKGEKLKVEAGEGERGGRSRQAGLFLRTAAWQRKQGIPKPTTRTDRAREAV